LNDKDPIMAQAILAGGCFWCTEAVFRDVIGVSQVESGYIGGTVENPSYKLVCTGSTGHAEAIRVTFDPEVIAYGQLLDIFFATHDPTQLNRQGNDVGTQYRSALFPLDEGQEEEARLAIARAGRARRACRDHHRAGGAVVSGRGLSSGLLGGRRPAQSLLSGGDSAQADEAAQELCGQGQGRV
jgi:methionine-S-sulfoxide reductase